MLAAAAHASRAAPRWSHLIGLVVSLALVVGLARFVAVQAEWIGIMLGGLAGWGLATRKARPADAVLAGVSAGLCAALYSASGLSVWFAAAICLAMPLMAAGLSLARQPISTQVRDYVLMAVAFIAPVVAIVDGVLAGWRSAETLNRMADGPAIQLPVSAWLILTAAFAAGVFRGVWKRR